MDTYWWNHPGSRYLGSVLGPCLRRARLADDTRRRHAIQTDQGRLCAPGKPVLISTLYSFANHRLQAHAGFFHLLPLGLRIQEKLEKLIDKHMTILGNAWHRLDRPKSHADVHHQALRKSLCPQSRHLLYGRDLAVTMTLIQRLFLHVATG